MRGGSGSQALGEIFRAPPGSGPQQLARRQRHYNGKRCDASRGAGTRCLGGGRGRIGFSLLFFKK